MNKTSFETLQKTPIHDKDGYFRYVKALYEEWSIRSRETGYPAYRAMSKRMAGLSAELPPQFFTGDIHSPFVIISLNPHADKEGRNTEIRAADFCHDWDAYLNFWTDFSRNRYARDGIARSKDGKLSAFDCKLHRFLSSSTDTVTSDDLARWTMFHMELFPIASSQFDLKCVDPMLFPYVLRALETIALYPRMLVLVLNGKLEQLLRKMQRAGMLMLEDFSSLPITIPGRKTRAYRQMYTVTLSNGAEIKILAARTFAMQGFDGKQLVSYSRACFNDEEQNAIKKAIG